jgi:riboflavin kinase/FMN adenylyltransferase
MKYINTTNFHLKNSAVSLGKFDGLHRGHRLLFQRILEEQKEGLLGVVFSFLLPPGRFLSNQEVQLIYTEEEKKRLLKEMGMDVLVSYPFDRESLSMEPEDFIREILIKKLDAKVISVGSDFHFGHNRGGDVEFLEARAKKYGYQLEVFEKLTSDGEIISSTRIRAALAEGNMEEASKLLGAPYSITGEVIHGRKLGRTFGMPTINMRLPKEKILPPNGVYASITEIDGKSYYGISNIGVKPTVGAEENRLAETFIFDYSGDLYGQVLKVSLYTFERPELKFASLEELKAQMEADSRFGRDYFTKITG